MCIRRRLGGMLLSLTCMTAAAFAPAVLAKRGAIALDNGIDFTPTVALSYWQNSNIAHTENNPFEASLSRLNVSAAAELQVGRSDYVLFYRGELGRYQDSPADDFDNHSLQFKFDSTLSEGVEVKSLLFYEDMVRDRGDGLTEGVGDLLDGPVYYTDYGAQFRWRYVFVEQRYWFDIQTLYFNRTYQNGVPFTNGRNRVEMGARASFFRAVSTGSAWFVEARYNQLYYDDNDPDFPPGFTVTNRDAVEAVLLGGIRWQKGELSRASLGIGYQNKTYRNPEREGFSGLTWEVELGYSPVRQVELFYKSTQAAVPPPAVGDYILQLFHIAQFSYKFRDRIKLILDFEYFDEQYVGFDRAEDTSLYGFGIEYAWRSNIKFILQGQREDKHSNIAGFTYDQNIVGLQIQLGLK